MALTARAFYRHITELEVPERRLSVFLKALPGAISGVADEDGVDAGRFLHALRRALVDAPSPTPSDPEGFVRVVRLLKSQRDQLEGLERQGVYDNPYRGFGVEGWYNFDILAYLECATRGSLGEDDVQLGMLLWEELEAFFECGRAYE